MERKPARWPQAAAGSYRKEKEDCNSHACSQREKPEAVSEGTGGSKPTWPLRRPLSWRGKEAWLPGQTRESGAHVSTSDQFNRCHVTGGKVCSQVHRCVWLSLQVAGPAAVAGLGAGGRGGSSAARKLSLGVHGGQRSPLWGSTLRVSLGWLRDSLGKREATLGRLLLFSGSPGGAASTKKGIS